LHGTTKFHHHCLLIDHGKFGAMQTIHKNNDMHNNLVVYILLALLIAIALEAQIADFGQNGPLQRGAWKDTVIWYGMFQHTLGFAVQTCCILFRATHTEIWII
jgi:TctA family transporter